MPSRDYFIDPKYDNQLMAYRTFAIDVATALGGNPTVSARDMNAMVDFEINLAKVCLNICRFVDIWVCVFEIVCVCVCVCVFVCVCV